MKETRICVAKTRQKVFHNSTPIYIFAIFLISYSKQRCRDRYERVSAGTGSNIFAMFLNSKQRCRDRYESVSAGAVSILHWIFLR